MGISNSILIVSKSEEEINAFRSKLNLLRDVDTILGADYENALELSKKYVPDTIIVFVDEEDKTPIEICKAVRFDSVLKNTPVMFVLKKFDQDYLLSGFDVGINDYICLPAHDADILMRIIWCLQKNETSRDIEKKETLLADLGVIDKVTSFYMPNYTFKVFENEILSAHKYKYPVALMALAPDKACHEKLSTTLLANILKKSTRNTDIVGMVEGGRFYIILPKTKAKGVCTVYERIKNNLGDNYSISIGACEVTEGMLFEEAGMAAEKALNDALDMENSIVIADKSSTDSSNQSNWLNKINTGAKNFKLFKQAFNKKLNKVIVPIFYEYQKKLRATLPENIVIEQFAAETQCVFTIKDENNKKESTLKISYTGFSKAIFDIFVTRDEQIENDRQQVELTDIEDDKLAEFLDKLVDSFN